MPQTSDSVSRGRTQVAKPLAAVSAGLTAPTAPTRAKAKPRLSATDTSADRRQSTGNKLSTSSPAADVPAEVPRQAGAEKITGASVKEISTKPKSQPSKADLSKESIEKPTTKEIAALPGTTSSDTPEKSEDSPVQPPINNTITDAPGDTNSSARLVTEKNTPVNVSPAADPLQVAAQAYPWLYMSSTLEACFMKAEQSAKKELYILEDQVSQDEADFADEEVQYESERLIEFCDELNSSAFAEEAPAIMQSFMAFGEICERVETEALQLAMSTPSLESEEPLQAYSAMMDRLDDLQEQASELESSILRLTEPSITASGSTSSVEPKILSEAGVVNAENDKAEEQLKKDTSSAREQIMGVFAACLPVLRARRANLSMAQELIDSAQENFSLALRMESMGID